MKKNKRKYCMGGKLPKYKIGGDIGDIFKNYGLGLADNALTNIGLSNVITDDQYSGKGSEFAKKAVNISTGITGKIAPSIMNTLLPGSGNIYNTAKQTVSNFNPKDNSEDYYANGGLVEVEKQENAITPDNQFIQFDGNSHEQGGIKTELPDNTIIFSDKLKASTGKTFAQENKKNNTNKEDKILKDKMSNSLAKKTAELMKTVKTKNSEDLFNEQESLKEKKINNYIKRLGGRIKYPNGGIKLPENLLPNLTHYLAPGQQPFKASDLAKYGYTPTEDENQYSDSQGNVYIYKVLPLSAKPKTTTTSGNPVTPGLVMKGAFEFGGITNDNDYLKLGMTTNTAQDLTQLKAEYPKLYKDGGWIKKAINPAHKGYCTPMTKSTCTGHRRALALTFKKHHGFHKKSDGGISQYEPGGVTPGINLPNSVNAISNNYWDISDFENRGVDPNYDPYRKGNYSTEDLTPLNKKNTSNSKLNYKSLGKNLAYGLTNNAGYLYDLYRAKDIEQETFNPMNPKYLDPTESLRQADIEARSSVNDLANIADRSSYMGARVAQSTANTLNKANILNNYENQNAQIANQFTQANNESNWRTKMYNASNRGAARNIRSNAIGNIGSNIAMQMNDNKLEQLDRDKIKMLPEIYNAIKHDPDYLKLLQKYGYK